MFKLAVALYLTAKSQVGIVYVMPHEFWMVGALEDCRATSIAYSARWDMTELAKKRGMRVEFYCVPWEQA